MENSLILIIPDELYYHILTFVSIRDIINFTRLCKYLNETIKDEIDDIIYKLVSKLDTIGRDYIKNNQLYVTYQRGKSYFNSCDKNFDQNFYLSNSEHILYCKELYFGVSLYNSGYIIITLNCNLIYTVYTFRNEINEDEDSPYGYGWDNYDIHVKILANENKYNSINEISMSSTLFDRSEGISKKWFDFPNNIITDVYKSLVYYPDLPCI